MLTDLPIGFRRHPAGAALEMLNWLGGQQYSRVHDVESGVHSCKGKHALFNFDSIVLKLKSRLAQNREYTLRGRGCKFERSGAKGKQKVFADIDGEARILGGRVSLPRHTTQRGNELGRKSK